MATATVLRKYGQSGAGKQKDHYRIE